MVRSFVRSLVSAHSFCTALLYSSVVRTCAVDRKADHGHKKGHAPRALHGALIHGHLKAANKGARCSTPNYVIAPEPCIARAPELVYIELRLLTKMRIDLLSTYMRTSRNGNDSLGSLNTEIEEEEERKSNKQRMRLGFFASIPISHMPLSYSDDYNLKLKTKNQTPTSMATRACVPD